MFAREINCKFHSSELYKYFTHTRNKTKKHKLNAKRKNSEIFFLFCFFRRREMLNL